MRAKLYKLLHEYLMLFVQMAFCLQIINYLKLIPLSLFAGFFGFLLHHFAVILC